MDPLLVSYVCSLKSDFNEPIVYYYQPFTGSGHVRKREVANYAYEYSVISRLLLFPIFGHTFMMTDRKDAGRKLV